MVRCRDGGIATIDRELYADLTSSIEERAINSCITVLGTLYRQKGAFSTTYISKEIKRVRAMHVILKAIEHGWTYNGRYWEKRDAKFVHMYLPIVETCDY